MQHGVGVDEELVHDARQLVQAVVYVDGCIGQDDALDGGVRDVALVPERHVLECRDGVAAYEACHARDTLAVDRVALVRHRGRTLLPRLEELLCLADVRALQVADLGGDLFHGTRDDSERRDELGVSVALDDLRCEADGRDTELLARQLLDARVDI